MGNTQEIVYEDIEKSFREEAGALLADDVIEEILNEEKKKFLVAGVLEIPASRFAGKQVQRYTKGLVRHTQPLSFLYEFLGFMMELSVLVFLYLLLYGAIMAVTDNRRRFFSKYEFLYVCVVGICVLVFSRIRQKRMGNFLRSQGEKGVQNEAVAFSGDERQILKKQAGFLSFLPAVVLGIICVTVCALIMYFGLSKEIRLDVVTAFLVYVLFAVLSGFHNVLYSSFFIPYCTVGGMILMRKSEEVVTEAVNRYKILCYERMLKSGGKGMEDFLGDEVLAKEMMQKLRGRLAVYRGGTFLGLLIPTVLAVVCLVQMVLLKFHVTAGLCVFTLGSLTGAVLFLLAFLSANGILRTLPKS